MLANNMTDSKTTRKRIGDRGLLPTAARARSTILLRIIYSHVLRITGVGAGIDHPGAADDILQAFARSDDENSDW